jgi:hypothetical protein
MAKIQEIPTTSYNPANTTKWIFNLPLANLFNLKREAYKDGNLLDYPLNCKSVQFPEFKLGTTQVSFLNYSFDVSTRQNLTQKILTVNFLLSENWLQYLMMLKWFELCDFTRYDHSREDTVEIDIGNGVKRTIITDAYQQWLNQTGKNPYYSTQGPVVNCNLYLMDNFMNRVATFNFEGCFLTSLKNVELDYSKVEGTEVLATFTMSYYKYNFVCNDPTLKQFILDGGGNLDAHDKLLIKNN